MGKPAAGARDFSDDELDKAVTDAEQIARLGFVHPAVIAARAGLEAAMRMGLRAAGGHAG